jgi:hypothetical protein
MSESSKGRGVGAPSDSEACQAVGVGPHGKGIDDPDVHKGVVEGDRPDQPQNANPHGPGVNDQGLPDDPVASAEDAIGAEEDESQG